MGNDIANQLRREADGHSGFIPESIVNRMRKGADEIDRLREQLDYAEDSAQGSVQAFWSLDQINRRIEDALERLQKRAEDAEMQLDYDEAVVTALVLQEFGKCPDLGTGEFRS